MKPSLKLASATLSFALSLLPSFGITPNAVETELGALIENHAGQLRLELNYDPVLNLVARAKAQDFADRDYFGHSDPDGYGPNKAVDLAGYVLPSFFLPQNDANFIESISEGHLDATAALNSWLNDTGHRNHLLAENSFYLNQTRYGVGYAEVPGSTFTRYYVFISAPPNPANTGQLEPYTEWLFSNFSSALIDQEDDLSDPDEDGLGRLAEFALGTNPVQKDTLPKPFYNHLDSRLEWPLPFVSDLGTVQVKVEHSSDLTANSWSETAVQQTGSTYFIPGTTKGFLRFEVSR